MWYIISILLFPNRKFCALEERPACTIRSIHRMHPRRFHSNECLCLTKFGFSWEIILIFPKMTYIFKRNKWNSKQLREKYSMVTCLNELVPVRVRRQLIYPSAVAADGITGIAEVNRPSKQILVEKPPFALYHTNFKLIVESKVCLFFQLWCTIFSISCSPADDFHDFSYRSYANSAMCLIGSYQCSNCGGRSFWSRNKFSWVTRLLVCR